MRSVLSLAVAAAITAHTVLGCCWHHAHIETADAATAEHLPEPTTHVCHHGHHAHSHDSEQEAAQPAPHHGDPVHQCPVPCSDKCQLASNGRVQFDESGLDFSLEASLSLSEPVAEPVVVAWQSGLDDGIVGAPPLRLHLLHQLLLI